VRRDTWQKGNDFHSAATWHSVLPGVAEGAGYNLLEEEHALALSVRLGTVDDSRAVHNEVTLLPILDLAPLLL